jgi:hypothetical protein
MDAKFRNSDDIIKALEKHVDEIDREFERRYDEHVRVELLKTKTLTLDAIARFFK